MGEIVKVPNRLHEVNIQESNEFQKETIEFSYEIIDHIHDIIHEKFDECIYTDQDYEPLVVCLSELISAICHMTQGKDHPFIDFCNEVFVDSGINMDYNENENKDE